MKRIATIVSVFSILLYGGNLETGYIQYLTNSKSQSYSDTYATLSLTFTDDPIVLEYTADTWDTLSLVADYQGEVLSVSVDTINLLATGETFVEYTVENTDQYGQTIVKTYTQLIEVTDTNYPEISLEKSLFKLVIGDSFNPEDYIISVSDPVDGELSLSDELKPGTYIIESDYEDSYGDYSVIITAQDLNGNISTAIMTVMVRLSSFSYKWDGTVLSASKGSIIGPSGKETYYNLNMSGVIAIMRRMGNTDEYWIREDGVKMLGEYVMVAANLSIRPRGSLVETSLGMGIVCDTGTFAQYNIYQLDIAVNW